MNAQQTRGLDAPPSPLLFCLQLWKNEGKKRLSPNVPTLEPQTTIRLQQRPSGNPRIETRPQRSERISPWKQGTQPQIRNWVQAFQLGGRISYGCAASRTLTERPIQARKDRNGLRERNESKSVEISENFHSFLHSYTFVVSGKEGM
jgi:hypothetical protein